MVRIRSPQRVVNHASSAVVAISVAAVPTAGAHRRHPGGGTDRGELARELARQRADLLRADVAGQLRRPLHGGVPARRGGPIDAVEDRLGELLALGRRQLGRHALRRRLCGLARSRRDLRGEARREPSRRHVRGGSSAWLRCTPDPGRRTAPGTPSHAGGTVSRDVRPPHARAGAVLRAGPRRSRGGSDGWRTRASWSAAGHDDDAVWGRYLTSSAEPYEVAVDLRGPAFRCTCPSRKLPCKHQLGLLLLHAHDQVPPAGAGCRSSPRGCACATVAGGRRRRGRAVGRHPRRQRGGTGVGGRAGWPGHATAAAHRPAARAADASIGSSGCVRGSPSSTGGSAIASGAGWPRRSWRTRRRGTVSRRGSSTRSAAASPTASGESRRRSVRHSGWHEDVLEELAVLHGLAVAAQRTSSLPEALADGVQAATGLTVARDDVLAGVPSTATVDGDGGEPHARGPHHGAAHVAVRARGRSSLHVGDVARVRHVRQRGRVRAARRPRRRGRRVLVPRRGAAARDRRTDPPRTDPRIRATASARRSRRASPRAGWAIAAEPWLERYPMCVEVAPAPVGDGRWVVTDATRVAAPRARLLAHRRAGRGLGGAPVTIVGEWSLEGFLPITVWHAGGALDVVTRHAPPPTSGARSSPRHWWARTATRSRRRVRAGTPGAPAPTLRSRCSIAPSRSSPPGAPGPARQPPAVAVAAAPDDPRPPCSHACTRRLQRIVAGEHDVLLPEWLHRCDALGLRPPEVLLPTLLLRGRRHPELDALVREVSGERARWLAEQVPELGVRPVPCRGDRCRRCDRRRDRSTAAAAVAALVGTFRERHATWAAAPQLRLLVASLDPDWLAGDGARAVPPAVRPDRRAHPRRRARTRRVPPRDAASSSRGCTRAARVERRYGGAP